MHWWIGGQDFLGVPLFHSGKFCIFRCSGGAGCSVGCSDIFSGVLSQRFYTMNTIQICLSGNRGNKGEKRKALSEQSSVLPPEYLPNQEVVVT